MARGSTRIRASSAHGCAPVGLHVRRAHIVPSVVPATDAARADADAALVEIHDPRGLAAFSNGDSGANNCLVDLDGGDGRLIDFEHACRRHGVLDAAALHVPGSMWMTVADPVPLGVEDTYQRWK